METLPILGKTLPLFPEVEMPQEILGLAKNEEKLPKFGSVTYQQLKNLHWNSILVDLFLTLVIVLLLMFLTWPLFKHTKCRIVAVFILLFFFVLLFVGDEFLKNLSIFFLLAILLTSVLTVFIFFVYDLTLCNQKI
jgi:hypothetical protein